MNLVEHVQYKVVLIVSGCWQGTSREKLYEELGWESLSQIMWTQRHVLQNNKWHPILLSIYLEIAQ